MLTPVHLTPKPNTMEPKKRTPMQNFADKREIPIDDLTNAHCDNREHRRSDR